MLHNLQLVLHGEVQLLERLVLSPDGLSPWLVVELVLPCPRLEPLDTLVVQPDQLKLVLTIQLNDQVIQLPHLRSSIAEARWRGPLCHSWLRGAGRDIEGAELRSQDHCAEHCIAGRVVVPFDAVVSNHLLQLLHFIQYLLCC